jgi:hypothetical protein
MTFSCSGTRPSVWPTLTPDRSRARQTNFICISSDTAVILWPQSAPTFMAGNLLRTRITQTGRRNVEGNPSMAKALFHLCMSVCVQKQILEGTGNSLKHYRRICRIHFTRTKNISFSPITEQGCSSGAASFLYSVGTMFESRLGSRLAFKDTFHSFPQLLQANAVIVSK